jgi:hypothetical protein
MTQDRTSHETKAARLLALYRLQVEGQLDGISDRVLARAFGTRRETIWKDRQALKRADILYQELMAKRPWAEHLDLPVDEAAAQLGCDADTVRGMIRGKLVDAKKVGGRWFIAPAEIERLKR